MRETQAILDDAVETPSEAAPSRPLAKRTALSLFDRHLSAVFTEIPGPAVRWRRTTYSAFFVLIGVWATLLYSTWATWGDLTVDSGHEMYVPAMLAAGKMLYRDVWFMYGPAAPYFNGFLFRFFGLHLEVLYWAGSLAALGSAIFLYLTGLTLGSWVAGWTAGAIVLTQAFAQGLFCFPMPYSFSAVYGCLAACVFLWLAANAARSARWVWMLGAGTVAAAALLLKLEFGVACYATLVLLMFARSLQQRSWKPIGSGAIAILPGALACAAVAQWMVSIAGADFITQENFMSWPTSYFMRAYGKMWLEHTGLVLSGHALLAAFGRICVFVALATSFYLFLRRERPDSALPFLAFGLGLAALDCLSPAMLLHGSTFLSEHGLLTAIFAGGAMGLYLVLRRKRAGRGLRYLALALIVAGFLCLSPIFALQAVLLIRRILFPVDMVLFVGLAAAAACWYGYRRNFRSASLAIGVLFLFPVLLAFRILTGMQAEGYPIYYNGTVILAFLFLGSRLIVPSLYRSPALDFRAELFVCGCCLIWVISHAHVFIGQRASLVRLSTARGVIQAPDHLVVNYQKAIAFMKEKAAAGDSVLSIPEDTSLYFLSGTRCPTRVTQFTPGVLAPGKMTEDTIGEIERKKVRYLLWSNRESPEYGVAVFGRDYDTTFAGYLTSHYRPLGPLLENNQPGWNAVVWERVTDENAVDQHRRVQRPGS